MGKERERIFKKIEEMIPYFKKMLNYSMTSTDGAGYGEGTPQYELWKLIGQYEELNGNPQ